MMDDKEELIERLRQDNEVEDQRMSLAEKKAAAHAARRRYGRDWRKIIGGAASHLKVNKETMQTLHSMGGGGEQLRDLSRPPRMRYH